MNFSSCMGVQAGVTDTDATRTSEEAMSSFRSTTALKAMSQAASSHWCVLSQTSVQRGENRLDTANYALPTSIRFAAKPEVGT